MSLGLIVGPPNSGRAGEILGRLRSALERDPLLVVPTGDDIARFERDLCRGDRPAIGATIRTFGSLTDEIATTIRSGATGPAPQRLALIGRRPRLRSASCGARRTPRLGRAQTC